MSAIDPEKKAIVQELWSRRDSLPEDKKAVVNELAGRFGISTPVPAKPVEVTTGDILSRFGSPTGQPESIIDKLKRGFSSPPNIVTGNEPTGNTAIDILNKFISPSSVIPTTSVARGLEMIPTAAKAGGKFEQVMTAAKDVPIDTAGAAKAVERAKELGQSGATLPKIFRDFIKNSPTTYEEGRNFAINASKLSSRESSAMTGAMKSQIAEFASAMKNANREAAAKVGMGELYDQAMKEYRQAKNLEDAAAVLVKYGRYAAITSLIGGAATAGYEAVSKALGH